MAQRLFEVGKGLLLNGVSILAGSGAPSGSGDTASAGVGSVYSDASSGSLYVKKTAGSGAGNWSLASSDPALAAQVSSLVTAINAEATSRQSADTTLQVNINALQSQVNSLGNAFNYVGTLNGGADSLNAFDLSTLPADGKNAGDYYKVAVMGWFKVGAGEAFDCAVGNGIVWNTDGGVDRLDQTNHNILGTAGFVSVSGSIDTGFTIDLDASVKAKLNSSGGMSYKEVTAIDIDSNVLPTFTPGQYATIDGLQLTSGYVLFLNLIEPGANDIYQVDSASGTFIRISPASSEGALAKCFSGNFANQYFINGSFGWESFPSQADFFNYLAGFVGADTGSLDSPRYTTNHYVSNGDALMAAIGKLDEAINSVNSNVAGLISTEASTRTAAINEIIGNYNTVSGMVNYMRQEVRRNYCVSSTGNLANGASATLINTYVSGESVNSETVYYNPILGGASKVQVFYRSGSSSAAFELMVIVGSDGSIDFTQYGLVKTGSDLNVAFDVITATSSNPQDSGTVALAVSITNNSGVTLDNVRASFSSV